MPCTKFPRKPTWPARPEAERERGWWFSKPERRYNNALDKTDTCIGYSESLEMVKERFALDGPFDGILGFSHLHHSSAPFRATLPSQAST